MIQTERYWLINGDNRDWYPRIGRVQAVITDPPYDDEAHQVERVARRPDRQIDAVQIPFAKLTKQDMALLGDYLCVDCYGWALIFCQTEQIVGWKNELESSSVYYNRPMLWIKPDAKPNFRGNGPGIGHEVIQAYWCGPEIQRWNGRGKTGIFYHTRNRRSDGGFKHPTEKPVALMKDLVRLFTDPDDVIFDPFMGCGSTGIAALELGRRFIGIERNEEYYAEAARRMALVEPDMAFSIGPQMPTLFGNAAFGSSNTKKRLAREAKERENASQQS